LGATIHSGANKVFLQGEIRSTNKNTGFVREDQVAELQVHTSPFIKYGPIVVNRRVTLK